MKYDAIIVGSGIGAMATATLLGAKDKKVLVLERNATLGGRLSTITTHKGFIVDYGVHLISCGLKGPLGKIFERVGHDCKLEFRSVRPVTSFQGEIFVFPHDLKERLSEEEYLNTKACLKSIYQLTDEEVNTYDTITFDEYLQRYSKDLFVQACFCNISRIFCGLQTWEVSAASFMRCLRNEHNAHSSGYPVGGCGAIIQEFQNAFADKDVEVRTNANVEKIVVRDNKAVGVMVNGEFIEADAVISNADIKTTVHSLVGDEYFTPDYVKYVDDLLFSDTPNIIRVALDKKISDVQMLTQIGAVDTRKYVDQLLNGEIPEELNMFLVCPSNFCESVAPEGMMLVNFLANIPTFGVPKSVVDNLEEAMLNTVEKYFPGLREHIVWKEFDTSATTEALFSAAGAAIGIGQYANQSGAYRPKHSCSVEGLYFVSASAGGTGCGTEMVMNSALEFVDKYYG